MTRKRKVRRERHHDPEAVLAGHEDIDGEDLFRLIHRVNPTGRNLEERERRRLYGQKARLQSLLVRRFSELVVVEPSAEEGVASLGHRSGQLDGGDAELMGLDARDRALRLVEIAADEARSEQWREAVGDLRGRIRQHWAIEIDTEPRPLSEIRDFVPPAVFTHPEAWLDDDGHEMILVDIHCFWLFIRVVDVEGERLIEQVSLQAMSLYPPCKVWRDGPCWQPSTRIDEFHLFKVPMVARSASKAIPWPYSNFAASWGRSHL